MGSSVSWDLRVERVSGRREKSIVLIAMESE
jgi:hypothetical protein